MTVSIPRVARLCMFNSSLGSRFKQQYSYQMTTLKRAFTADGSISPPPTKKKTVESRSLAVKEDRVEVARSPEPSKHGLPNIAYNVDIKPRSNRGGFLQAVITKAA